MTRDSDSFTKPLNDARKQNRYADYYACGEMIELLAQAALKQNGHAALAHWNYLFEHLDDRQYTGADYFNALKQVTGDRRLVGELEQFTHQGFSSLDEVIELFQSYGIELVELQPTGDGNAQYEIQGWVTQPQ